MLRRAVIAISLIVGLLSAPDTYALSQQNDSDIDEQNIVEQLKRVRHKVFRGMYHTVIDGDSVMMIVFNDIDVFPPLRFKNKKQEEYYWRTVRDVRKALPYAKLISETLTETYEYLQTFQSEKERKAYLKEMENEVFNQYKPALKRFTKGQAKILVKLIGRETNQSGYDILKAFLGTTRALFYHGFGKLFGVNINSKYNPIKNKDDATINRIATLIEQGQL